VTICTAVIESIIRQKAALASAIGVSVMCNKAKLKLILGLWFRVRISVRVRVSYFRELCDDRWTSKL